MPSFRRPVALGAAVVLALGAVGPVFGSSHRESPYLTEDPKADNTDVYAFVSPDDPDTVTLIANYLPVQEPGGGPNFYRFDPDVLYEIHVDNDGDARDDVTFQFRFKDRIQNKNTILYNTGPITSITDPDYNYRQTYSVKRLKEGKKAKTLAHRLPVPPDNIGPRSLPDYEAVAEQGIHELRHGIEVFAGQRDDPFFIDVGSAFDLLGLRPFNEAHLIPREAAAGVDGLSGFNVNSIAIRVPIKHLTRDGKMHAADHPNATIGVWASASRQRVRVLKSDGTERNAGRFVQVSRLANPLFNEVLIPLGKKDYWNRQTPRHDAEFVKYAANPEPAKLINLLYPTLPDIDETDRQDLVTILMTGVPGLNYTGPRKADLLRLNTGLKPNASGACYAPGLGMAPDAAPSSLGVLDGDLCGFPNGRRLMDDTPDIEFRAIAEGYGAFLEANFGLPNKAPNNQLGDGVDENDMSFLDTFPYVGTPWSGYSHPHDHQEHL